MHKLIAVFLIVILLSSCSIHLEPYPELQEILFTEEAPASELGVVLSEANEEYLVQMREEFRLDDLKQDNDLKTILAVTDWVHTLWSHDGSNTPDQPDPVSILRDVKAGKHFRCVEYSIVIAGALNSLGIPTRVLSLRTADMETRSSGAGHVVCEAYLAEEDRWLMIDGQWNVVTFLREQPINAVQLQTALLDDPASVQLLTLEPRSKERYKSWIAPYLYFFQYRLDQRHIEEPYTHWSVMLVPLGESDPEVFQVEFPIYRVHFTHNYNDFYQQPRFTPLPTD